jgi:hypothetical protein
MGHDVLIRIADIDYLEQAAFPKESGLFLLVAGWCALSFAA